MYGDHTEICLQNFGYVIRDVSTESPSYTVGIFEGIPYYYYYKRKLLVNKLMLVLCWICLLLKNEAMFVQAWVNLARIFFVDRGNHIVRKQAAKNLFSGSEKFAKPQNETANNILQTQYHYEKFQKFIIPPFLSLSFICPFIYSFIPDVHIKANV